MPRRIRRDARSRVGSLWDVHKNGLQHQDRNRWFYRRARDCATRASERYRLSLRCTPHVTARDRRRDITSYTNVCPLLSSGSDASIDLLLVRGRQMRIRRIGITAFAELSADTTRPTNRPAVFSRCGEGVLQGPLLRYGIAVLQTAVNIVYWLPPPISQTLVTRSCRSPTANKPRAVISRRCLPFLVPPNIPRFDGLSVFRPFDNSTFTSAK